MKSNFCTDIHIEQELILVGRILLFFNKNRITIRNMNIDEIPEEKLYHIQISLSEISEKIDKITKLISKQVGVFKINYQQSIPTSSKILQKVESI